MKNLFKSILVVLVMTVSATGSAQQKAVQKAVIKTTITCDHCKACETCGGLLEKKLLKTKGIQMITLNEQKATIEVIFNSKKTDLPAIRKATSDLGYDADEIKANPEGYQKLDGCCKPS